MDARLFTLPTHGGNVTLRYGELVFRFTASDPSVRFRVPPEYAGFEVSPEERATCTVTWRLGRIEVPEEPAGVTTDVWENRRTPDGDDATIYFCGHHRTPYLSVTFDATFTRATIVHDPDVVGYATADVGFYPMAEMMACRLLSRTGAVDLHASTATFERHAYVFMGHSGAGKTTMAELAIAAGAEILSDDRTIVAVRDGTPLAWGTPWHGSGRHTSSRVAPIRGIFLLLQADHERVVPMTAQRAFKELYVRLIHQKLSEAEVADALATLEALVAVVPVAELHFRRVPAAFRVALESGKDMAQNTLSSGAILARNRGS